MLHESLVAPLSAVTGVAGTKASARYVECGPKLVTCEAPRPTRRLNACVGPTRSLRWACAFSSSTAPCEETTNSAKNVAFSLKLPPAQSAASAMVSAELTAAPLSALPALEFLSG